MKYLLHYNTLFYSHPKTNVIFEQIALNIPKVIPSSWSHAAWNKQEQIPALKIRVLLRVNEAKRREPHLLGCTFAAIPSAWFMPFVKWQILSINSTSLAHHFKGITLTEERKVYGRSETQHKKGEISFQSSTQVRQLWIWWWREPKIKDWRADKHTDCRNGPEKRSSYWYMFWKTGKKAIQNYLASTELNVKEKVKTTITTTTTTTTTQQSESKQHLHQHSPDKNMIQ